MKYLAIILPLLLLTACETNQQDKEAIKAQTTEDAKTVRGNVERHTTRVSNNLRDQVKKTSMKLREWWLTPLPEPVAHPVAPAYCYAVLQDIMCYREPLPGKTHMLVGYQGEMAQEPPLAQTKALPVARMPKDIPITGAQRVANTKPVFVKPPVAIKVDKSKSMDGTDTVGSEPLPDPMSAPQL